MDFRYFLFLALYDGLTVCYAINAAQNEKNDYRAKRISRLENYLCQH